MGAEDRERDGGESHIKSKSLLTSKGPSGSGGDDITEAVIVENLQPRHAHSSFSEIIDAYLRWQYGCSPRDSMWSYRSTTGR